MRKGVKQSVLFVCQSVCQSVSQSNEKFLNLNIDRVKTDSSIDFVRKVTYVYLIGSKTLLYPLLFQEFPIKCRDHPPF